MLAWMHYDVVVIGAGAAGLMCAIEAGKRGRSVLVLERNDRVGRRDPHFRRRALQLHQPLRLAGAVHLGQPELLPLRPRPLHAGRLHRAGRAARHRLSREEARPAVLRRQRPPDRRHAARRMRRRGRRDRCDCEVWDVGVSNRRRPTRRFELETSLGDFACESLVVATGGLSIPKMGATDFGAAAGASSSASRCGRRGPASCH